MSPALPPPAVLGGLAPISILNLFDPLKKKVFGQRISNIIFSDTFVSKFLSMSLIEFDFPDSLEYSLNHTHKAPRKYFSFVLMAKL